MMLDKRIYRKTWTGLCIGGLIILGSGCDEAVEEGALTPEQRVEAPPVEKEITSKTTRGSAGDYNSTLGKAKGAAEGLIADIEARDQDLQDLADGVFDEEDE